MKNKRNIIIGLVLAIIMLGTYLFSAFNNQSQEDLQALYDDFQSKVINGNVDNCESGLDVADFPDIQILESECYFKQGMQNYEASLFEAAQNSFNSSLEKSDSYSDDIEIMRQGITLVLHSVEVNTTDQVFAFDVDNQFSYFNELMAFVTIHPFNDSDTYLVQNQFLPQIIGLDNWTDGELSFRYYGSTLYTDINRLDSGESSQVFYIPDVSDSSDWNVTNDYGVILMEEIGGTYSWEYRYKIIDLDTIVIVSSVDQSEVTLYREISK